MGFFTLDSTKQKDRPDLKITCMLKFMKTRLMSSLTPAVYGSITRGGLSPSIRWEVATVVDKANSLENYHSRKLSIS